MAEINLSKNQQMVVNTRGKNILVSAAAGSGKTFVLVQRILKLISEGINIDSLLIVTFTNNAASEMKSRIANAINNAIIADPNNQHLKRQALLINKATISTIDSFCGFIVKNNFYKTELDPGYRILDKADELKIIKSKILDRIINQRYIENDTNFINFMDTYSSDYSDENIEDIIYKIYAEACHNPDPIIWLENCRNMYNTEKYSSFLSTPLGVELSNKLYGDDLDKLTNGIEAELAKQFPYINILVDLIIEFHKKYMQEKIDMNIAEFNDIQHYALNILIDENGEPTDTAKLLKDKYTEIIVDEYQDSSNLQEAIFTAISKGNNMFMVGDIKQSIYKFRRAEPALFIKKYNEFPNDDNSKLIELSDNYRSKPNVLEFANLIFSQIMCEDFGSVNYTDEVALKPKKARELTDYNTEVHILEQIDKTNLPKEVADELAEITDTDYEAEYIAEQIKNILNTRKDIKPCDIAILTRVKKVLPNIMNSLAIRGISAITSDNSSICSTLEIQTILAILKVIDNPLDNIPFFTVVRSHIYNISNNDLVKIMVSSKESMFYNCMLNYIKNNNDELSNKLKKIAEDIDDYKKYSLNNSIAKLLSYIYDKSYYYTYVSLLPNGKQRQSNLDTLIQTASNYEQLKDSSISEFIKFIENANSIVAADVAIDNENCVNIMTIHKSKGLEFPIVILGFTGSSLLNSKVRNTYPILNSEYGFAIKYAEDEYVMKKSKFGNCLLKLNDIDDLSESVRLLYVALTRAKEQTIVIGYLNSTNSKNLDKIKDYHYDPKVSLCKNYPSYLLWILICLGENDYDNIDVINIPFSQNILSTTTNSTNSLSILNDIQSIDINKKHSDDYDRIINNLSYEYHNKKGLKLPVKTSISEIKRRFTDVESETDNMFSHITLDNPKFLSDKKSKLSQAQKGTIYHSVFEHLDFLKVSTIEDIKQALNNMVSRNLLSEDEISVIDINKIYAFTQTDLYNRLQKSGKIYKETQFMMSLKSYEVYGDEYKDTDSNLIVRGIIDLYFIEDDHIILVDYKTDYVKNHNVDELKEKYRIQLDLYKRALEQNTGMKVTQQIIYSVYEDCEIFL